MSTEKSLRMSPGRNIWLAISVISLIFSVRVEAESKVLLDSKLLLSEGWFIQSSTLVHEAGEYVSTGSFDSRGWYPASVPSSVLSALVADKVYPDPRWGMNLRSIPGTSYPIGESFGLLEMPPDSPFRFPWWYRTSFRLPDSYGGKTIWLHFKGINYRANIWLNGHKIADSMQVVGAFRTFEFDVTEVALPGEDNILAVEVYPPLQKSLAINWVDVNPAPPDKQMGIWREVYVSVSGPVALRYPDVITDLEMPSLNKARLMVTVNLQNARKHTVKGVLKGVIENIRFAKEIELTAEESKLVKVTPEEFPQLNISRPRIWWPWQLGEQNLYELKTEFESQGQISDSQTLEFGIRDVTSELTEEGHRLFKINGRRILIRGAMWWSDMMLQTQPEKLEAQIRYARDMNLNTLRLDGKFEDDYFLSLCDQYGILLMPGWLCCDHWERWESWDREDYSIAAQSLRDQIRRLRTHPSVFVWLNADDIPPIPKVERSYVEVLQELNWPNPVLSSATGKISEVTGDTGVKMSGPYKFIPPAYWYLDKARGGAFGYLTETSPCATIPLVESLRKFLPEDHLWPIDEYWDFHAGGGVFKNLKVFAEALNARYGEAASLEDFVWKAQLMSYEAQRAMYEAYGRNKYISTGVIHEMLISAWPSLIWNLFDYYLQPGGAYFGAKKGCEPLHIQYSYDDRSIVIVNSFYKPFKQLKAKAKVYNHDLTEKFSEEEILDIAPDGTHRVFTIPQIQDLSTLYFLKLSLEDIGGKLLSSNFYWLSTRPEILDWEKSTWYYTPAKSFADFTGLKNLPPVELKVRNQIERLANESIATVTVENPTQHLAFAVHLRFLKSIDGDEVLPILWQDNYFSLLPGEKRDITAKYKTSGLNGAQPVLVVDGWNVTSKP